MGWGKASNFYWAILAFVLLKPDVAYSCGWWGDSEMSSRRETAMVTPEGHVIEHSVNLKNMKLPGRMGYAIAVPEPGRAIPYLLATFGQPLNRIQDLKIFGFRSVIDLGTPSSTAILHRKETESVGMRYFSIPVRTSLPNQEQSDLFNRIVIDAFNGPLLIYSPKAEWIGATWTLYRLSLGAPLEFAIGEGRSLGLIPNQEKIIREKAQLGR